MQGCFTYIINSFGKERMKHFSEAIAVGIATTLGCGFFPIAPGTVGSAVAVILFWFLPALPWSAAAGLVLVIFVAGVWAASIVEKKWHIQDPGQVNWDEFLGQYIALLLLPHGLWIYLGAFIAFRFFDIAKIYPINRAEALPAGWGIMMDDVIAGIFANLLMRLVLLI
jgi:phosphatidylglycerophosphatase A